MIDRKWMWILLIIILIFPVYACNNSGAGDKPAVFKQNPEVKEIKPQKPVKIKLKRNAKGSYSWDISGNNADEVLETDKKLRKGLGKKGGKDET